MEILRPAALFALVVVDPLFSKFHAPAIADGLLTSWDWRLWGDDNRKFTAIVEQNISSWDKRDSVEIDTARSGV